MEGANKTPEFLKMNPMHCIPAMDDDGFTMWESKAILRYICNKHKLEQWYVQRSYHCDVHRCARLPAARCALSIRSCSRSARILRHFNTDFAHRHVAI